MNYTLPQLLPRDLPPAPLPSGATLTADGRVKRFSIGDRVRVGGDLNGPDDAEVLAWVSHSLSEYAHFGGCGRSAKYLVSGYDGWVYDWQLERASHLHALPAAV